MVRFVDFLTDLEFGRFAGVDRIEINSLDNVDGDGPILNNYWAVDDILIG